MPKHIESSPIVVCSPEVHKNFKPFVKRRTARHGMYGTPENKIWRGILRRCFNKNDHTYKHYGARGITVCERWLDFVNFFADMGMRPSVKHWIERLNTNGNYEPGNCKWATSTEQNRNRRDNHLVTMNGKTMCLAAWVEELGLSGTMVRSRIGRGWSAEKALTEPRRALHICL